MIRKSSPLFITLLICTYLIGIPGCGSSPPDLATMVEEVRPGVVRIETWDGSGSGVIFDTDSEGGALVLTNYHVVEWASRIDILVGDSKTYRGQLRGFDAEIDLAVVHICCGKFENLSFGDVSQLKPGSAVITIGYPLGLPGPASVTGGIVSAIRSEGGFIQTDAPMNPGNSGGPLLSPYGEVLGVNTVKAVGIDQEGLGFAVSERVVQRLLPELKGETRLATDTDTRIPKTGIVVTREPTPTLRQTATPVPSATPRPTATLGPTPTPRPTATQTPAPTPVPTPTPTPEAIKLRAITVSLGAAFTCGIRMDHTPVCWGVEHRTGGYTLVPAGEKLTSISSGAYHTCGLRPDETVVCWGSVHDAAPPEDEKFTAISSGSGYTCGLRPAGTVGCWGNNPGISELGGFESERFKRKFKGKFKAISAGGSGGVGYSASRSHPCGLRLDGTPVCLANKIFVPKTPEGEKFTAISNGSSHACALRPDGSPVCWEEAPVTPEAKVFTAISSGVHYTCALSDDGTPVCWGENHHGKASPPAGEKFTSISSGHSHTCALRLDGTPVCWGRNLDSEASPPTLK